MKAKTYPKVGAVFQARRPHVVYKLESEQPLGEGNFGIVFRVREQPDGRLCVLKVFNRMHVGGEQAKRDAMSEVYYLRELQDLKHPNIIEFVASFEHPEYGDFIVTYPLCKCSLEDRIRQSYTYSTAMSYFREVAEGLCAIHTALIYYGDLAARNVLVTQDDHIRLADFGVCLNAVRASGVSN